jgi:hypothetical protein
MANHNASSDQLNLFNQPIEILVEVACTVERAAMLVGRSKGCIYSKLRQNQNFQRDVATGTWKVYSTSKKDGSILVDVAFAPTNNSWMTA